MFMTDKYKTLFKEAFLVSNLCDELLDFIPADMALYFIKEKFKEEYTPRSVLEMGDENHCSILNSMSNEEKIIMLTVLFDITEDESKTIMKRRKAQQLASKICKFYKL